MGVLGYGLGAGADVEFFVDAADIDVYGREADAERFSDFFVEITAREQVQDFTLARGQLSSIERSSASLERLDDFARDVAGHGRAARMDLAQGCKQFVS